MIQQVDSDTVLVPSSKDGFDPATTVADPRPQTTAQKRRGGILKTVLWGGSFVVTAIASATVGLVIGFTAPATLDPTPEQEQPDSIADLWRKGVRHQLVRPVNILVMGIDQVPGSDRADFPSEDLPNDELLDDELLDDDVALTSSTTHQGELSAETDASQLDFNPTDFNHLAAFSLDTSPTVDLDRLAGRSDAMLLVQLNPEENTVNVLSIPRDTQVQFPDEVGVTKINHANLVGGPRLAAKVVSHNLAGVEIDRYVRINTTAFRELVDAVGGVEITVPTDMNYTDQTQGLYIDLAAGKQVLMGDEAEQFARFRGDTFGDIGRVQRQQQLLGALRDRLMSANILPRIPSIVQLLRAQIDTNLTSEEFLAILNFALEMEQDDFRMVMLPGTFSQDEYLASYWLIDRPAVNQVLEDYFQVEPSQLVAQAELEPSSDQAVEISETEEDRDRALKALRIAVQNASSDPEATDQLIRYLQGEGFTQVYSVSSPVETQLDTQIIVQRGSLQGAALVEQTMGQGEIVSASIGDLSSDLTIRIGNDWHLPESDEE
ncbi:MAG: LCP family protein [Leptolyngbyaceae cyanobacterium]